MGHYGTGRERMVQEQLRSRDITDERLLAVMSEVPRHCFVDDAMQIARRAHLSVELIARIGRRHAESDLRDGRNYTGCVASFW